MAQSDDIWRLIADLDGPPPRRERAVEQLVGMGAEAFDVLIMVVESGEGRKAWFATEVLGQLNDPRVFPVLVRALRSAHPMVGSTAVKALLRFDVCDVLDALVEALPYANIMAQQSIVLALQRLGDERAVPTLLDQLTAAESSTIRSGIIQTLGKLGDPRAIPAIRDCLDDENHHVRDWSAAALEQLGAAPDAGLRY